MPSNIVRYSGHNKTQKSVFMSTFNKGKVSQTRSFYLKFTNNVICENLNSSFTKASTACALIATGDKTFSKGILAIKGNFVGCHFYEIIIDTDSAVI